VGDGAGDSAAVAVIEAGDQLGEWDTRVDAGQLGSEPEEAGFARGARRVLNEARDRRPADRRRPSSAVDAGGDEVGSFEPATVLAQELGGRFAGWVADGPVADELGELVGG
jgi:hypothetical protein